MNSQRYIYVRMFISILMVLFFLLTLYSSVSAQCAMCTAVAESSRASGASVAESINKGVMYIFMMPFLLMGTILYFWWRAGKKAQAENSAV